jgi:hypothetical protein
LCWIDWQEGGYHWRACAAALWRVVIRKSRREKTNLLRYDWPIDTRHEALPISKTHDTLGGKYEVKWKCASQWKTVNPQISWCVSLFTHTYVAFSDLAQRIEHNTF